MAAYIDLIRPLELRDFRDRRSGHFLYNPASGKVLDQMPFFGGSLIVSYGVRISHTTNACATGTLGPVLLEQGERGHLELYFDYRAWVLPQHAANLVVACAGAGHPGVELARKVVQLVQEVISRSPAVLDDADPQEVRRLQQEAEGLLLNQLGLSAILNLRVDDETAIPTISTQVQVHTHDYPTPISLQVEVDTYLRNLEAPMYKVALSHRPPDYLWQLVASVTREALREVPVALVRGGLDRVERERLHERLATALATAHVRVRAVRAVPTATIPAPPAARDLKIAVEYDPPGYPGKAQVRAHLHLELHHESAYWRAQAPELTEWANTEARRALSRALVGVPYSQLCLEPESWIPSALAAMRHAATTIGYRLTAEFSGPSATETRFLQPFPIELDEEYATKLSAVRTRLMLAATLRLESMDGIRKLLDRGANIEQELRKTLHEELSAYLHSLHPGYLFLYFDNHIPLSAPPSPPPSANQPPAPSEETIQDLVHARVSKALQRAFGITVRAMTLKLGPSELRAVHDELLRASAIPFEVEAILIDFAIPVLYLGALEVIEIRPEDWPTFQRKQPSCQVVAEAASRIVETLINEHTRAQTISLTPEQLHSLSYEMLPDKLRAQLGVSVRCVGWRRARGGDDKAWTDYRIRMRDAHIEERQALDEAIIKSRSSLMSQAINLRRIGDLDEAAELERQAAQLRHSGEAFALPSASRSQDQAVAVNAEEVP